MKSFYYRPVQELKNLIKGFVKSMLFAGGYTLIVRRTICFLTEHYKYTSSIGSVGALLAGVTLNF